MKVLLDDDYVASYTIIGDLEGGIEVSEPEDIESFEQYFAAYKLDNGTLILDESQLEIVKDKQELDLLRWQRERECFPVINRGELWYSKLTEEQLEELSEWYNAWLEVTETRIIPKKPSWLG